MRGPWFWPSDTKEQEAVLRKIWREDELTTILAAFNDHPEGLSNAQIDKSLRNNAQWRTLWHLKELMALGLVEYVPHFFGDPGRYVLSDRGRELLHKVAH